MNDFTAAKLADFGKAYGHSYSVLSKTTGYPVAMTSKYPITDVTIVTDPMTHAYIRAKVHGYDVLVTHLNPHEQQKE
jgi:exodeoxyribonuclease-3